MHKSNLFKYFFCKYIHSCTIWKPENDNNDNPPIRTNKISSFNCEVICLLTNIISIVFLTESQSYKRGKIYLSLGQTTLVRVGYFHSQTIKSFIAKQAAYNLH